MSYPPPPGNTPPPQGYPVSQGYPMTEPPRYPPHTGAAAPSPSVILLAAFVLMLIGVILRSVSGMMDLFADSTKNVFWVGNLILGIGLFAAAYSMFGFALKDKELLGGVRTGAVFAAVLLIFIGIWVSSNLLGQFGNVVKAGAKATRSSYDMDDDDDDDF